MNIKSIEMNIIWRCVLGFVLLFPLQKVKAETVTINGLCYDLGIQDEKNVAIIVPEGRDANGKFRSSYSGHIDIPTTVEWETRTYEVIGINEGAFANCEQLKSIKFPDNLAFIGKAAFYKCTGLTSITIPSSVTSIGYNAFYGIDIIYYNGSASGEPWGAKNIVRQ